MSSSKAASLDDALRAQNVPILGVQQLGGTLNVVYADTATATDRQNGAAVVASFDTSDAAQASRDQASRQAAAQAQVPAAPADVTITELKAVVMLTMDELNLLRKRLTDQDAAVAAATSLADLKSRWATVATSDPMPQRTPAQVETALQNRIATADVG